MKSAKSVPTHAVALALALSLSACTATPPTITPSVPTPEPGAGPTADPNAEPIQVDIANSELAVGEERVAFTIRDKAGNPIHDGTVQAVIYQIVADGRAVKVAEGPSVLFGPSLPDGGVWVVYSTFDSSGAWAMDVIASRADGWKGQTRVNFTVAGRTQTPRVGQAPPLGDTPVATGGDLSKVTSDESPDAELYELTVEEAAKSTKPTVIYFGSPAHCEGDTCRAVLEEVKAVKARLGSQANFIHVESRDLADPTKVSAATTAWGLPSEPWVFVLDKNGHIAARVEGDIDRDELGLLVERALGISQPSP